MSSKITECPNCGGDVEELPAGVGFACLDSECGWTDLNLPVSIATDSADGCPLRQWQVSSRGADGEDEEIIASPDELIVFGNRIDARLIRWDLSSVGGFNGDHSYSYRLSGSTNWHIIIEARMESSDYQDTIMSLMDCQSSCCLRLGTDCISRQGRGWYLVDSAYFDIEDLSIPLMPSFSRRPSHLDGSEWRDDGRLYLELNFTQYGGKVRYVEE